VFKPCLRHTLGTEVLFLDLSLAVSALALYRKPQESHIVAIPTPVNELLFYFTVPQNLLHPAGNIKRLKSHLGPFKFKHETCQDVKWTRNKQLERIMFTAVCYQSSV